MCLDDLDLGKCPVCGEELYEDENGNEVCHCCGWTELG